ncbi:MAG: class I SAM-dependent methyltransferase [Acidobacteriota bacterium]|nr:class I SAM-dependent methyltransferase [Acidobacteriota bacterium]
MAEKRLQDLIARLEHERLEADRRYNDALTALDAASRALTEGDEVPGAGPSPNDWSELPRLNRSWDILASVPARRVTQVLSAFIWRVTGPALERQHAFNAAMVKHLNRNVAAHDQAAAAVAGVRAAIERDHAGRARFHAALITYLQTITAYVDSKDRALGGAELREQIVLTSERTMAVKRDVERLSAHGAERTADGTPAAVSREAGADFSYVGFEDRFRGSQAVIRQRLEDYVPLFAAAARDGVADAQHPVLDIGCGRGELLALLAEAGVPARGIDANGEMAALCLERGLAAQQADALSHLESLDDASLGGLVAIQVVEHLAPAYLARLLDAAFHKLQPGAPLVLETINPACWMAFFETYIRDLTHAQPIHPDTLRFLVQASGFSSVDVEFRSPVTGEDRLARIDDSPALAGAPPALRQAVAVVNSHADALNARLFSYMDYAVIARR